MTYEYDLHESKEEGRAEGRAEGRTEERRALRPCLQMVNLSRKSSSIRVFPKRMYSNCVNLVWNRQQSNFEPP